MTDRKAIPKFATEAEEAKWYFDHRDELETYLGPWRKPTPEERAQVESILPAGSNRGPTKHVPLRIPAEDVALAKALAAKKGLPYQTFLKGIIHEGLKKLENEL